VTLLDLDHGRLMDRVYRRQRHLYDATRRFYLLGRDELIEALDPPAGARVLELGCGTGRNLFSAAERYPQARFYGIDISLQMLATALERAERHPARITFAHGDAAAFNPLTVFGVAGFERVFISYALSMIPEWRAALSRAAAAVAPGGRLHIVDFGQQEGLPGLFRLALYRWLAWFHVEPRSGLLQELQTIGRAQGAEVSFQRLYRGYAWALTLTRPSS
jgi:S-adenosylmethionine-diacylgycerolhomoserine-N-methlytransferase